MVEPTLDDIRGFILRTAETLDPSSRYMSELLAVLESSRSVAEYDARLSDHELANSTRINGDGEGQGVRGLSWVDPATWENMDLYERTLANLITGETRMMFRFEDDTLRLLEPTFRELAGPTGDLDVLCVPCSSGKEVFSYAIIGLRAELNIFVRGVDRQDAYLKKARSGDLVYHFRDLEFDDSSRWLDRQGPTQISVKPEVLGRCLFSNGDVLEGTLPQGRYAFVACQNLLGYFQPEHALRALENLDSRVKPGGCLLLDPFVLDGKPEFGKPELFHAVRGWLADKNYERVQAGACFLKKAYI